MAQRYDACTPRKGKDDKTYWTKIGSMFPSKDGKDQFTLNLDALPIPDSEGRVSVTMFVPKEKEGSAQDHRVKEFKDAVNKTFPADRISTGRDKDMNDDIPF